MTEEIKRYDCEGCSGYCYGGYHMADAGEYGDYVKAEDFDRVVAVFEEERDALRKSVDQLADTLKNVHEAVCETLGIEGDDALPELVADWAEGEYAALRKDAERYRHMRASFARDIKHRLTWYLPARTPMTVEGLDSAIDAAIDAKEPNRD